MGRERGTFLFALREEREMHGPAGRGTSDVEARLEAKRAILGDLADVRGRHSLFHDAKEVEMMNEYAHSWGGAEAAQRGGLAWLKSISRKRSARLAGQPKSSACASRRGARQIEIGQHGPAPLAKAGAARGSGQPACRSSPYDHHLKPT